LGLGVGIESSCDETGVALVRPEGSRRAACLLSHALHSQIEMHQAYGGVVPELASRDHIRRVLPLTTQQVLARPGCTLAEVDVVAYTRGPAWRARCWWGGRGLCAGRGAGQAGAGRAPPGRAFAVALSERRPAEFPVCGLAGVGRPHPADAGGRRGPYELLGETIDDAAGEAFDKSAKLMGLGYPGGPALSRLASRATPTAFKLPRPLLHSGNLDFSFAGLKTAVLTQAKKLGDDLEARKADLAASTEAAIVEVLVKKSLAALAQTG
jgi:N6-L-threonylcarbamoyladenine synthase